MLVCWYRMLGVDVCVSVMVRCGVVVSDGIGVNACVRACTYVRVCVCVRVCGHVCVYDRLGNSSCLIRACTVSLA